ncbi:mitochondrial carrier [Pleomassaria siparia CBS 279.74]|uniref:Mitochondrial carrier n=1 Tax=Pleomassaria siparia CBS 279.74 TaxID=1314801 RepID=A0A6G1JYV8_9PLEO|nr:mitochondrial carrier [Pleomassaria siparia CBS 279.74]
MATSRDAPNPLRPYYVPPSIGPAHDFPQNNTASTPASSYSSRTPKPSFGSQARDILSDLDYDSYLPDDSPTLAGHAKKLIDQALWNYTSVLLAQPFEVAKTILQVHQATGQAPALITAVTDIPKTRPDSYASGKFQHFPSDDSDDESPDYFTSVAPRPVDPSFEPPTATPQSPVRRRPNRSNSTTPTQAPPPALRSLELRKSDSLFEVIAQLWQKESAWGVWKGTNVTFVYNFLLKTTESWTRSLLSALLNVPDAGLMGTAASGIGGLDIIDSSSPLLSLAVAVTATAIAAFALAPLDIVRTRLIVTPTNAPPRTIYPSLSLLPSLSLPPSLLPATILHATIPTIVSSSTPLILRSHFAIDPILTPSIYSLSTFLSSITELFLRLPVETVLRRGQVAVLQEHENARLAENFRANQMQKPKAPAYGMEDEDPSVRSFRTIVEPGPYKGLFGTMWFIVRDEGMSVMGPGAMLAGAVSGSRPTSSASSVPATPSTSTSATHGRHVAKTPGFAARTRIRKGQGVHGLWRGWRVGFWGLVGVWGAAALGGSGGEF